QAWRQYRRSRSLYGLYVFIFGAVPYPLSSSYLPVVCPLLIKSFRRIPYSFILRYQFDPIYGSTHRGELRDVNLQNSGKFAMIQTKANNSGALRSPRKSPVGLSEGLLDELGGVVQK